MKKGIAYGVGVGPGDPELMTLKAIRVIRENEVIAVPGNHPTESVAFKIAVQAIPELSQKVLVPMPMPMVKDRNALQSAHRKCADTLKPYLDQGKNVVYITLGDPTVYCTFSYLHRLLESDGYAVELISGVPSFCAAAAALHVPLAEWDETLHVIPAVHVQDNPITQKGNYVLMKSAGRMRETKSYLRDSGRDVFAAENCGMSNERLYGSVDEIPDDAGYFCLIIAKDTGKKPE